MDGNSKADFINSAAAGQILSCPECGTANAINSKFCYRCGFQLIRTDSVNFSAFETVVEPSQQNNAAESEILEVEEPVSVFAEGLPEWDIVPPEIVVRRHRSR